MCYTLDKLLKCTPALQHVCCRPLREGVDRNFTIAECKPEYTGRPLREGVDRNSCGGLSNISASCRPLREGVDRNYGYLQKTNGDRTVALHVEGVGRNPTPAAPEGGEQVALRVEGVGRKRSIGLMSLMEVGSLPPHGGCG